MRYGWFPPQEFPQPTPPSHYVVPLFAGAPAGTPKIATLQTTFPGSSLPAPFVDASFGGTSAVSGGQLRLGSGNAANEYGYVNTGSTVYDLDESAAYWVWTPGPASFLTFEFYDVTLVHGYQVHVDIAANTFRVLRSNASGYTTVLSIPYNAVTMKWGRVREASGVLYFETAPASGSTFGSWTTRYSEATNTNASFPHTAVVPGFSNVYQATADDLGFIDALNDVAGAVVNAKISTLQTAFPGLVLPPPFVDVSAGGSSSVAASRMALSSGDAVFEFALVTTRPTLYDLDESAIEALVTPSGLTSFSFSVYGGTAEAYRMAVWADGNWRVQRIAGGVGTTLVTLPYSATTMKWWRFREGGGLTYFETAANNGGAPGTWTTRWSDPTNTNSAFDDTAVAVTFGGGYSITANVLDYVERVNDVSGSVLGFVLVLADRNGGASPIAFSDQWVGELLLRVKTGGTYVIVASNPLTGTVTLARPVLYPGDDESYEFRLTEPLTNRIVRNSAYHPDEPWPAGVSSVNSTLNTLTISDSFGGAGTGGLIVVDTHHVDWYAEIYTRILGPDSATGDSTNHWWTFTGAVTAVAIGDLVIGADNATPPYAYNVAKGAGEVTAIDVATKRVTVKRPWGLTDLVDVPPNATRYCQVFRRLRAERISATVAGTSTLTVGNVAGITADQAIVFFRQLDGAGEVPTFVDHPQYTQPDPDGYGVKVGELARAWNLGITQLIPNSWGRVLDVSGLPAGWSLTGTATRALDTVTTRYGGHSLKFTLANGGPGVRSPIFYPAWNPGHTSLSVRAWVYFDTFTVLGGVNFVTVLSAYPATAAGAPDVNTLLGQVTITPINSASSGTKVDTGTWIELKIEGVTLAETTTPYGVIVLFETQSTSNPVGVVGYLDTLEAYPYATCPEASYEFGDAPALVQSGNRELALKATPPVYYEARTVDLAALAPDEFARLESTMGGNARFMDPENGQDVTLRLLRRARLFQEPEQTTFQLAERPLRFTRLVKQAQTPGPAVQPTAALIVSGAAPGILTDPPKPQPTFTTFAAPTTVPEDHDVATPVGGPIMTVKPGASVTYIPAAPTSPTTTVAVAKSGAAPRPRPRLS